MGDWGFWWLFTGPQVACRHYAAARKGVRMTQLTPRHLEGSVCPCPCSLRDHLFRTNKILLNMHIRSILATAVLATALTAQSPLVYDNGPFRTGPGVSLLNNVAPSAHTLFGFGVQAIGSPLTTDNSMIDDFVVPGVMIIDEVECYFYQTGSSTTSTITGVFVEFYDQDPATAPGPMVGSPTTATNLLTASSTNVWSGVYRALVTTPADVARPIMAVRVALPTPLLLANPGTYWIRMQASGSLASGPWMPPMTVVNQDVTGNSRQRIGLPAPAVINPGLNGVHAAGVPFKLFGQAGQPGSIVNNGGGCGTATLAVNGSHTLGGFVRSELGNVSGIGFIGYGLSLAPNVFCGCTVGHEWSALLFTSGNTINFPAHPAFAGMTIGVQGADFGTAVPGGCQSPAVAFTDTYAITLNM